MLLIWFVFRQHGRIVVAQSPYEGVCGAIVKNVAGWLGHRVVVIVESHGDFEQSLFLYRRVTHPVTYRFMMRKAAEFSLRHADILRAISQTTREQLLRLAPGKPVEEFMAWTDIEPFLVVGQTRQVRNPGIFLYAGVIAPTKGLIHLVKAFSMLVRKIPEARLLLVGREQNPKYAQQLKDLASTNGIIQQVDFMSEIPQKQLAERMGQADIFVLPSLSEGLGRVVVEAMAAGMPVIGSRVGGIPEIVQHGKTGVLVSPGDEQALAEQMYQLLKQPEKTFRMGQEARDFATQFFSEQSYVQGYARLLTHARKILQLEVS
jgi:glycosyltransferase involved in cell wall biosynthesis